MVIVEVDPAGQGLAAFLLGGVAAGVGPAVGKALVEAFYLAVALWPVGPCLLHRDPVLVADRVPQV